MEKIRMEKESNKSKGTKNKVITTIVTVFVVVFVLLMFAVSGEMILYVAAAGLPVGLLMIFTGTFIVEEIKRSYIKWMVSFLAWLVCYYVLLLWVITQMTVTQLFYLMMIGLPLGIALFGAAIYPAAKKYG